MTIDFVTFSLIIDDIVFPDGQTAMGMLGGGGLFHVSAEFREGGFYVFVARTPPRRTPAPRSPPGLWPRTGLGRCVPGVFCC